MTWRTDHRAMESFAILGVLLGYPVVLAGVLVLIGRLTGGSAAD